MIDPELQNIANEITNETRIGANTAQKIGALFSSLIEKILPVDDIAQSAGTSTSKVMSQAAVRTFVYAIRDAILKGSGFNLDSIQFNPATETLLTNIGQLRWNAANQTLEIKCSNDVTLSIGQENYIRGKNAEATQILNGKVVYVSGGQGANSLIKRASNNNTTGERVIGVATQNIDPNSIGFVTTNGIVNEINTSAFAEGDVLWLGVDGALTNVKPGTDVNQICIGVVLRSHATQGSLLVSVKDDWRGQVAQLRSDLSETTYKITELQGKVEGNNIDVVRYSGESSNKGTANVYNINLSFLNVGDKCKLKIEVVEDISLIYIFTRASLATLDVIDKIDYNKNNILAGEVREYEYTKSEDSNYLGICQSDGMGVSVKLEITVNSNDGGLIGKVNNTIINASQYLINGNVVYGDFGNIKEADVLWADGINGRLVNSSFDNFVMEYSIVSVTKGDNTIVYTKTFDDNGNVIKITINII